MGVPSVIKENKVLLIHFLNGEMQIEDYKVKQIMIKMKYVFMVMVWKIWIKDYKGKEQLGIVSGNWVWRKID